MKCILRIILGLGLLIGGLVIGQIITGVRPLEYYGE